jgi:hypothetical protein
VSVYRAWTDDELGLLADASLTNRQLGQMIGRPTSQVRDRRRRLERGQVAGRDLWTDSEKDTLRDTLHLTDRETQELIPWRTVEAIQTQRCNMGLIKGIKNAQKVGRRTLIAKTCAGCGELLDGAHFPYYRVGPHNKCKTCLGARKRSSQEKAAVKARSDRLQAASIPTATKHGDLWTEADVAVLLDPDLTPFEVAVRLRRTYYGVLTALDRYGPERPSPSDIKDGRRWTISAPNAEQALAQHLAELAALAE